MPDQADRVSLQTAEELGPFVEFAELVDDVPSPPLLPHRVPRGPDQIVQDRELIGVLMADEWMGLRLLDALRDAPQGLKTNLLARRLGWRADECVPVLASLHRYGAVEIEGQRFLVSTRGWFMLLRIDELISQHEATEEVCLETAG